MSNKKLSDWVKANKQVYIDRAKKVRKEILTHIQNPQSNINPVKIKKSNKKIKAISESIVDNQAKTKTLNLENKQIGDAISCMLETKKILSKTKKYFETKTKKYKPVMSTCGTWVFSDATTAASYFGIERCGISRACRLQIKAVGYYWKYINDVDYKELKNINSNKFYSLIEKNILSTEIQYTPFIVIEDFFFLCNNDYLSALLLSYFYTRKNNDYTYHFKCQAPMNFYYYFSKYFNSTIVKIKKSMKFLDENYFIDIQEPLINPKNNNLKLQIMVEKIANQVQYNKTKWRFNHIEDKYLSAPIISTIENQITDEIRPNYFERKTPLVRQYIEKVTNFVLEFNQHYGKPPSIYDYRNWKKTNVDNNKKFSDALRPYFTTLTGDIVKKSIRPYFTYKKSQTGIYYLVLLKRN